MNVTQTALTIKSLHDTGMTFAQAVERTVPGADPEFWRKQIAAIGKPSKTSKPTRTSRTSKSRQVAKQAAAMAELVGRVNEPRVVARIASTGGFTAEVLSDGTTRYVDADEVL